MTEIVDRIILAHGGGGTHMSELISDVILPSLGKSGSSLKLEDSAFIGKLSGQLSFTTDSFVVSPRVFPGGSLGSLSIIGTANDLAVSGAKPLFIAISLIIEEGFAIDELKRHLTDAGEVAWSAGISIVCGDTKVVPYGGVDGLFITTTGIGEVEEDYLSFQNVVPDDEIIISGDIGRHESAIISERGEFSVQTEIESDMQLVYPGIKVLNENVPIHFARDLTRGGLSMSLHDIVRGADVSLTIDEDAVPVNRSVSGLCEILGVEPFSLANEGTFLAVVESGASEKAVEILKEAGFKNSARIGIISEAGEEPFLVRVKVKTGYGTVRLLPAPLGETSPRIC